MRKLWTVRGVVEVWRCRVRVPIGEKVVASLRNAFVVVILMTGVVVDDTGFGGDEGLLGGTVLPWPAPSQPSTSTQNQEAFLKI